jgi:RND family efflux transporter MFP subunit
MNRTLGKLTAVVLGAALVAGFLRSQARHPAPPAAVQAQAPVDVVVAALRSRDVPVVRELFGTLEPRARVALASKALSRVEGVAVEVGQSVAAGASLVTLDDASAAALAAAAEAEANGAREALAEAERELERTRALFDRGARTDQELARATTERAGAAARLVAAEEASRAARVAVEDTRLVAPFAGLVAARHVEPGDLARPGETLVELVDVGELRLSTDVPESLVAHFALGASAAVHVDALALDTTAVVVELAPDLDTARRTRRVELALARVDGALPGMFARVRVELGRQPADLVPASAVQRRGGIETLFTLAPDGARVVLHVVRSGATVDGDLVLTSGPLAGPGDAGPLAVVVESSAPLVDGATVHRVPALRTANR